MNQKDQMFKYKQLDAQGAIHIEESKEHGRHGVSSSIQKYSGPEKNSHNTRKGTSKPAVRGLVSFLASSKTVRQLNQTI